MSCLVLSCLVLSCLVIFASFLFVSPAFSETCIQWTPVANLQEAKWALGAAVLDGKIYAVGGGSRAGYSSEAEAFDPLLDSPYGRWEVIGYGGWAHIGRVYPAVVSYKGEIWAINGNSGTLSDPTLNSIEIYNPREDHWYWSWEKGIPSIGMYTESSAAVELDGKIYVMGGRDPSGTPAIFLKMWDGISWVDKKPPPAPIYNSIAVANNKKIYVPGVAYMNGISNKTLIYDPEKDDWDFGPTLNIPRGDHSVATLGNKIFVLGGEAPVLDSVEFYDLSAPHLGWQNLECNKLTFPRMYHSSVVLNNEIYVIGGDRRFLEPGSRLQITNVVEKGTLSNQYPVADAGPDQTVNEWSLVTLDGSGSSDPDGDPLTCSWGQIAGTPVVDLNLFDPIHPTFTAPEVGRGGATLTFQLTVNDGQVDSPPDTVNITVANVNHPPKPVIECPTTVREGDSNVLLSGGDSYDPDMDAFTYSWIQTGGTSVDLSDPTAASPTFTAPSVGRAGDMLTFALTVDDGLASATAQCEVFVDNVNHCPTANAGEPQTRDEKSLVTLNGSNSSDPDGDSLNYNWTQASGLRVDLLDASTASPHFIAPFVDRGGATLVFKLLVDDGLCVSEPSYVTISIQNVNDPPRCDLAKSNPSTLWPPNHGLIPVQIANVTDPQKQQVTISITGVTQDEPVNGLGDGDTSPDAVIQGDKVLLRAERAGGGNGRVYQIAFQAVDSFGESCTGSVSVCVPHDQKKSTCVNDGQIYNSLQP